MKCNFSKRSSYPETTWAEFKLKFSIRLYKYSLSLFLSLSLSLSISLSLVPLAIHLIHAYFLETCTEKSVVLPHLISLRYEKNIQLEICKTLRLINPVIQRVQDILAQDSLERGGNKTFKYIYINRLVGLVVSTSDYWSWSRGFDPRHFHKF